MNYYKVAIQAGHNAHCTSIDLLVFYFRAKDAYSAIKKARAMPGVKHNKFSAVQYVEPVTQEEYDEKIKISAYERRGKE